MSVKKVGILALQGDFEKHENKISELGHDALLIKTADRLREIDALIIPGGESSTLLKLLSDAFRHELESAVSSGLPTLATCAGLILLARRTRNPSQESLGLLNVDVVRNAYGRQLQSFVSEELNWTAEGVECITQINAKSLADFDAQPIEGIFIRAPKIDWHGNDVRVLIEHESEPVLVLGNNILAACFHPELSNSTLIHRIFLELGPQAGLG